MFAPCFACRGDTERNRIYDRAAAAAKVGRAAAAKAVRARKTATAAAAAAKRDAAALAAFDSPDPISPFTC